LPLSGSRGLGPLNLGFGINRSAGQGWPASRRNTSLGPGASSCWCGWTDSNRHACAHAPQTCVSTNFTTSAWVRRPKSPWGKNQLTGDFAGVPELAEESFPEAGAVTGAEGVGELGAAASAAGVAEAPLPASLVVASIAPFVEEESPSLTGAAGFL
jgi:hypothetical protein